MNNFKNLVFEGGGVRGIAYGGALAELERRGILKNIKRVAGTSAGAITAVLLAVGYNDKEVSSIVTKTSFNDFSDSNFGFIRNTFRVVKNFGWCKGDFFRNWIGQLISDKTGRADLTFKDLKDIELQNKKELYLVGTNLSTQFVEIFSHEHTPDTEIRNAARISMGIPLYFKSVKKGKEKHVMVDGGVSWNYPLNIFDNRKYLDNPNNGKEIDKNKNDGSVFNYETLGFRLDSRDEIFFNQENWANVPQKINNVLDYSLALVTFMQDMANKRHLHENDWQRTIFIDTLTVKTTDFDISEDMIRKLIQNGASGVNEYFSWREKKSGLKKPA